MVGVRRCLGATSATWAAGSACAPSYDGHMTSDATPTLPPDPDPDPVPDPEDRTAGRWGMGDVLIGFAGAFLAGTVFSTLYELIDPNWNRTPRTLGFLLLGLG